MFSFCFIFKYNFNVQKVLYFISMASFIIFICYMYLKDKRAAHLHNFKILVCLGWVHMSTMRETLGMNLSNAKTKIN